MIGSAFRNQKMGLPSRIRPYGIILIINILVGLVIWAATGIPILPIRPWMVTNLLFIAALLVPGLIVLWISRWILAAWRHRRPDRRIRRMMFKRHFGWPTLARAFGWMIAVEVVITIYTTIKQAIPLINSATYDLQLIAIEKWIHFGFNPAWELAGSNPPLWWAKILDFNYYLWFLIKPLFFSYFLTHRNQRKRDHFISVYLGVWIVGVLMGLAIPSHGPCYVDPQHFPAENMGISRQVQEKLGEAYQNLSRITLSGNGNMTFGMGLMALPSLHVTACILYVYFFWGEGLGWRWGTIIFSLMIFLGSLYSGWHYAIDGYVGVLIVLFVGWATKKLCYSDLFADSRHS